MSLSTINIHMVDNFDTLATHLIRLTILCLLHLLNLTPLLHHLDTLSAAEPPAPTTLDTLMASGAARLAAQRASSQTRLAAQKAALDLELARHEAEKAKQEAATRARRVAEKAAVASRIENPHAPPRASAKLGSDAQPKRRVGWLPSPILAVRAQLDVPRAPHREERRGVRERAREARGMCREVRETVRDVRASVRGMKERAREGMEKLRRRDSGCWERVPVIEGVDVEYEVLRRREKEDVRSRKERFL